MRVSTVLVAGVLVIAPACGNDDHKASGNDNTTTSTAVPSGRGGVTGDPVGTDASTTSTEPQSGRNGVTGAGGTGGMSTSTTRASSTTTGQYTQR